MCIGTAHAQQNFKVNFDSNIAPSFTINENKNNAVSSGIEFVYQGDENMPFELGFQYARGYNSSVAFSYGIVFAYHFWENSNHKFRGGFKGGRIKMDDYRNEFKEGGIQEDNLHENFNPFMNGKGCYQKIFPCFSKPVTGFCCPKLPF